MHSKLVDQTLKQLLPQTSQTLKTGINGGECGNASNSNVATRVLVTGAAGQIAYSLLFEIASGRMLGANRPVILHLVDIPAAVDAMKGVLLELEDCAFPLLKSIIATSDLSLGFANVDIACLVGAMPRKQGMERKDLLKANVAIFKEHGQALNKYASKNVKVVVVGNPANTNAYICMKYAPDIPRENFTALTRLDQNRAQSQVAKRLKTPVTNVKNVIIWGNHSATQYPDVRHGYVDNFPLAGSRSGIVSAINDSKWLDGDFIKTVQQRGAAVIAARKLSSAASAANAISDHVRDWVLGTKEGEVVSMGVISDGSYGVPEGIIYSFPLSCSAGKWRIVQNYPIDLFSRDKLNATAKELLEEKAEALQYVS